MPDRVPKSTEPTNKKGISRRDFLKDAGLVVGGATIGSAAILNACSNGTTVTAPGSTQTKTVTTTQTVGAGATVTVTGGASTVTVTAAPVTKIVQVGAEGVITLNINGQAHKVEVKPEWTLAWVIREKLNLPGTKMGCDRGECGSCTVLINGKANLSCMWLAVDAQNVNITTIEGLANGATLHKVQQSFLDKQAFQCGFCTPGMIMSAVALLQKTPNPTLDQVKLGMSGNLCYCGDHNRIVDAVMKGGQ